LDAEFVLPNKNVKESLLLICNLKFNLIRNELNKLNMPACSVAFPAPLLGTPVISKKEKNR
jgi:hypothetical protein